MRSKDSVDKDDIKTIEDRYQFEIEREGEKRISTRLSPDRDIVDVRADQDLNRLLTIIQRTYLRKVLYLDNNDELVRKLCYDSAKLVEASHSALKANLTAPLVSMVDNHLRASFFLLSDCRPLIRKFLDFDYAMYGDSERDILTRWRQVEKGVALYAYAMYSLANGDFDRLDQCIQVAIRLHNKGEHKRAHLDIHVRIWEAIRSRNKDVLVTELFNLIRKAHWHFNPKIDFDGEFISSPAVGYLKAAWLLDLEVEVDHKYIPMEMMPFKPLPVYEKRYWFLLDD